ncbi:MAG: hypothetical protein JSW07_13590 [bacterium]|nr:MAG: hypothetical protein JSW07_13590 [bacterium]
MLSKNIRFKLLGFNIIGTKIITLCLLLSILALFIIPTFSQENNEEEKKPDRRMMRHKPIMRSQHQMMDMQKMGAMIDSSTTQCNMMIQHMKQMNVQNMMGDR